MWQNENAQHLGILIAEQNQSIRQTAVTKTCNHEMLPKHYKEPLPVIWVAFKSHLLTRQSDPFFFFTEVLQPVLGTSSTLKKSKQNKLVVFYRTPCIVLLKIILIYQLYIHTVVFQLSFNFWNLQKELYTFSFQKNLQRLQL